jgi:hypothetical protein
MEKIIAVEDLEQYRKGWNTRPAVYYKNLHLLTRCFVGESVVTRVDGREQCVQGARAILFNAANEKRSEVTTDSFGDFKFDNMEPGSGRYTIRVTHADGGEQTAEVDLKESVNVGTIVLS